MKHFRCILAAIPLLLASCSARQCNHNLPTYADRIPQGLKASGRALEQDSSPHSNDRQSSRDLDVQSVDSDLHTDIKSLSYMGRANLRKRGGSTTTMSTASGDDEGRHDEQM